MERTFQPPYASKEETETKTSRSDEARRAIEEYANDLREIIKSFAFGFIESLTSRPGYRGRLRPTCAEVSRSFRNGA